MGMLLAVSLAAGLCAVGVWSKLYLDFAVWIRLFGVTFQRTFSLINISFDFTGTIQEYSQQCIQYLLFVVLVLGLLGLSRVLTTRHLLQARAPQVCNCRSAATGGSETKMMTKLGVACIRLRAITVLVPLYFV